MAVIAISQQIGSRGLELGRRVAEELAYHFMSGDDLYAATSQRYSVTPEQLLILDERTPHFWERAKTDTQSFAAYYRATVLTEFARGNLVAVGRAVAHVLPQVGCGLRVRVVAPFESRVNLVALEEKLAPAAAERRVLHYDREVRARVQSISNIDIEDASLYDLVINTANQPLEFLATTLTTLARKIDGCADSGQWQEIRDAAITQQVRAALLAHPKIRDAEIIVSCTCGAVRMSGPGLVPPWDELVDGVARQIEGVASVNVAADEPPMPLRSG
ncbi:MAG TPA: cytidylate kinase family protein [Candidatus Binataceae bacterium]